MGKKFKALFAAVFCVLLSFCFFACGKAELNLSKNSATMTVGESITLIAESSKGGDVTWTSDDVGVVTVKDGVLTAIGAGQAKITAEADGVTKTVSVTVRAQKQFVVNVDGVSQTVEKGALAEKPADPVKEADAQYTYTFAGWYVKGTDKAWDFATPVEEALVIESRFTKTVNKYAVSFNGEATDYEYGAYLTAPAAPTKDADAQFSYTFDGWYVVGTDTEWNFAADKVTGKVDLEARFAQSVRTYTVTVNGVVSYAKYGETIAQPAYEPTKASTATTVYTFDKWVIAGTTTAWDFANDLVTGDVTLEASFIESDRAVDVVYVVDGSEYLRVAGVTDGATVKAPANPEKQATVSTVYTFAGWYVAGTNQAWDFGAKFDASAVAGDTLTLTARFVGEAREYTVTLIDGNDTDTVKVAYGEYAKLPEANKEDAENVYLFGGWYLEDGSKFVAGATAITGDVKLTAKWVAQPKFYTVSYYNEAGVMLGSVNVKGGDTASAWELTPVKNQTVSTVYTFADWVTADGLAFDFATAITENVKLYASYTETVRQYDVTLMNGDEVFAVVKVDYNTNFSYDINADIPTYSTAGQYFVAWAQNGATTGYTGLVLADMTLYAITDIDTNTYTVTVKVEGSEDKVFSGLYRNDEIDYGTVTAPATENVAATKNVLVGWAIEGTDVVYGADDVLRCPENGATFVAVFEEQYIYYDISVVLSNDAYTVVDENGAALTKESITDKKWGDVVKFKIVKNSNETYGTAVVKAGSSTLNATNDVYSLTVISDMMLTVNGLAVREYEITGKASVLAKQSNIDWAKTITKPEDALIKLTKDGEVTYVDAINADGTYTINGLRAGEYTVQFAYENAYGEKIVISESYTKTLNYQFDANDDGKETWTVADAKIGVTPFTTTNDTYVVGSNGAINQTTITGSNSKDCTNLGLTDFVPGNSDFAVTFSISQNLERQSAYTDPQQEPGPTFGFEFISAKGEAIYFGFFGEGGIRCYINGQYQTAFDGKKQICNVGGIFGKTGWPDAYREVEYTVVRKGDMLCIYLTAYNPTNANIKPVRNKLVMSADLSTGYMETGEAMTGVSTQYPVMTGMKGTLTNDTICKIFEDVTKVQINWGVTSACAVDFYGINYSYSEEVINAVVDAQPYNGKLTVGGDTITDAVEFIAADGKSYKTYTNANGNYSITLAKGEYTVIYGGIKSLEYMTTVTIDGSDLETVNVDYGFRGQEFVEGNNKHVTKPEPDVTIIHDNTNNDNAFNDVVIKQPDTNQSIVWSQPIAEHAVWGFTLDLPEKFAMYNGTDEPYDNDVYLKMYIGGVGSEFYTGLNSAGGAINLAESKGNFFQQNCEGTWANWKDYVSAGYIRDFQVMFERNNDAIKMYLKYPEQDTWFLAGQGSGKVAASGDIFFRSYLSGRHGASVCVIDYTIRNPFYYEGAVGDKSNIVAEDSDTAVVTVNKETASFNEIVTVSATPASKHAITDFIVNGISYSVPAGQTTYTFPALGYSDYVVTAVAQPADNYVKLYGAVNFERAGYANYYSLTTGTVTATGADGQQYVGNIVDGNYTMNLPSGTYDLFATTGKMIGFATITVDGETNANITLTSFEESSYAPVVGNGLTPRADGSLHHKFWGVTQESGLVDVTFTPNKEIIEYGFTLKGNLSGARYPFLGAFVKEVNANRGGKFIGGAGSGDQAFFMTYNDYGGRLGVTDKPWEQWKGGFIMGQEDNAWDATGQYYASSYTNLDFKIRVDGYQITMWLKGTNKHGGGSAGQINHANWVQCFSINIRDRYQQAHDAGKTGPGGFSYKAAIDDTLYRLDQPCYFGPSVRTDCFLGHYCPPLIEGLWFEITQR